MQQAGPIHTVHWLSKGKAVVVYKNKSSKKKAAELDKTTIEGNSRYITVIEGSEKRQRTDSRDDDPKGSCRVLVLGFDFGTTDEQFEAHMKQAGPIHTVHWLNKGKAVVVYRNKSSKVKAGELDGTTIDGNSRYVTVISGNE